MTFTTIKTEIMDALNLTSTSADTRVGRIINQVYRAVTSACQLSTSRDASVSALTSISSSEVTFTGVEKIHRVWYTDGDSVPVQLREVLIDELRAMTYPTSDAPRRYAVRRIGSDTVTIQMDVATATAFTIHADGYVTVSDLSGTDEPAFPESFHDILIHGVLAREYKKLDNLLYARDSEKSYQDRLSDLRMYIAKSNHKKIRQRDAARMPGDQISGGGGSGGGAIGQVAHTITALWTFFRGSAVAPFAIQDTDAAYVPNLGSEFLGNVTTDRLIGRDTAGTGESEQLTVGGGIEFTGSGGVQTSAFTGDVTKSAGGTVQTIPNDTVTYAKMQNVSAASKLLGRGDSGSGDVQEVTLGTGLSMSGTTLNSAGTVGGSDTQVQFNDGGVMGADAGLVYNKTTDRLTTGLLTVTNGQIVFPASVNTAANVNTFDDYERGTWTPVLGGDGGTSGQTYASQHGEYCKVGRMLFFSGTITLTAKGTITGNLQISGLPFSIQVSHDTAVCFGDWDDGAANSVWVAGIIGSGGVIQMRNKDSASTTMSPMDTGDVANNTACEFFGCMLTSV